MSRRAATLAVSSILVLVLGLVGALIPVPYVALTPGPTINTLGNGDDGKPLIQIDGRQTYPDQGHLNFTTVAYRGGPGNRIDLFTALRGWLDSSTAIVPEETLFPKNESVKQVEQENTLEMENSQQLAVAAALNELKIPVGRAVLIDSVTKGMPADGRLRKGDELIAVNDTKIGDVDAAKTAIGGSPAGKKLTVTYIRDKTEHKADITPVPSPTDGSQVMVGVVLRENFKFPINVKITVHEVGGPSAGLMFSLAIFDKLTQGSLTGGKFVAGTGTITSRGEVGAIGGIQQKMIAARQAGATAFLTPAANCAEAVPAAPKGLRLIKVDTMHGAVTSLDALRTGKGTVPACPKS